MKKSIWFLMILFSGCSEKTKPLPDQINDLFSQEFKSNEPGAAVLVMMNGDTVFKKGYGVADITTNEKITPHTLFNAGSISKTFVSTTILLLANDGKLNVNNSLYQYFPNFKNSSIARKIKLHHLLTHTSGLPDNRW